VDWEGPGLVVVEASRRAVRFGSSLKLAVTDPLLQELGEALAPETKLTAAHCDGQ
jgi:hypothetical protein